MTRTAPAYLTKYNASSGLHELHYIGSNFPNITKWKDQHSQELIGFNGEVERENLFLQSSDLSTTWAKINAGDSISTNQVADHSGEVVMDAIVSDATDTIHGVTQDVTLTAVSHVIFGVAKKGTKDWIYISDETIANCTAYFDLNNGAVGTKGAGADAIGIMSLGGGLYRWYMRLTGTAAAHTMRICAANADEDNDFAGNGSDESVYFSRINCTAGVFPSSFIETTTGTAIRTADSRLRFAGGANLGSEDLQRGTATFALLMKSRPTATRTLLSISDGGSSADEIKIDVLTDGTLVASSAASSGAAGSAACATDVCTDAIYLVGIHWQKDHLNLHVKNIYTGVISHGTEDVSCDMPDDLDRVEVGVAEYGLIGNVSLFRDPIRNTATLFNLAA